MPGITPAGTGRERGRDRLRLTGETLGLLGRSRTALFGIDAAETTAERRGFRGGNPGIHRHLGRVAEAFVEGYHWALTAADLPELAASLEQVDDERLGFAYEGAGMGVALRDQLAPWKPRLGEFCQGAGSPHLYMVIVGAGWAMARLPAVLARRVFAGLDPVFCWLAYEGLGFHQGFFHLGETIDRRRRPRRLRGYARDAFDQGVGRCLWFTESAEPERLQRVIAEFGDDRASFLWSGVGLACAYAGGVESSVIERVLAAAGAERSWLAQGVAFAAKARARAAIPTTGTETACRVVCRMSLADAAELVDDEGRNLSSTPADGLPTWEVWRRRIHARFEEQCSSAS